jgi:chromosome segregation protein
MFLKELEIFGFKSFPEKTNLKFEPGITVIVGPNGCGKSNLLDALKWSLGEQSPKSLRGSKMEDIIFNGTENHPPLSYAEVTLTFANEDGYLPIEYKEVAVTRRLYRSGESEYLINKNNVRLKDVDNLFMGTGIGEATYSFIEQGKIEVFLSYKPEDKRLIFDEASGIVKYKESKRETMRKLEETEENLLRLDDIISEVKRQIRYLQRQVEKTRKFKECQEKLIEAEKKIAALKLRDLETKINALLEELNNLKQKESAKETELNNAKQEWQKLNDKLRDLRKDLQEASSKVFSLGAQVEASTNYISLNQQRQEELKERNSIIEQSKRVLGERLVLQEKKLQEEQDNLAAVKNEAVSLSGKITDFKEEKNKFINENTAAKKAQEAEKLLILEEESEGVNTRNNIVEIQTNVSSLTNRKKRLLLDRARLEGFLAEKKGSLTDIAAQFKDIEVILGALRAKKENLTLQEKDLVSLKENLQAALIEKEKELVELNSYFEFLRDLRTKYDTFSATQKITVIFEEEPKDIHKLIISLKDISFQKEGSLYKASLEAKVISLEEGQLKIKIEALNLEIDDIRRKIEDTASQKQLLNNTMITENNQLAQTEHKWQRCLQDKENLEREILRFNDEFALVDKELDANRQELEGYEFKQKTMEVQLASWEEKLNASKQKLQSLQDAIVKNNDQVSALDVEIAKLETRSQLLTREIEGLNSKINFLNEERLTQIKNTQELDNEREQNISRSAALNTEIEKLKVSIARDKENINNFSQDKQRLENEELQFSAKIEGDRKNLESAEKELELIRSAVYDKKLQAQGLDFEKEKIKDYLRQVYHIELASLAAGSLSEQDSLETFLEEKEALQKKIESLGEVNLVAIEEFDELRKREDFLDKQKNDLIAAKENLKKAIQKINKTSKELFLETFAKIEEEFKKNFRFLFGGGRAELLLLDKEDVLESGVEIEVQPPGKKLQNVALLSGGEKALTTIALIFAIFKARPSPICVLDEIDAPLDEANVDRFNYILKEFAANSQFIVITHNKKTMSRADILYGVTMQEKGVSKLVSVKFAENGNLPEPAAQESAPAQ